MINKGNKQLGAAIVEITIVLPLLLLLLLAISEVGRLFYTYNTLNKTLQTGARHLSSTSIGGLGSVELNTSGPDGNAYQAINLIIYGAVTAGPQAQLPGLTASDISITSLATGMIKVDVNYQYIPMIGSQLTPFGFGDPIDMSFILNSNVTVRAL